MTNLDAVLVSPLDCLCNRAPVRHDTDSPTDWYIRLADWHLTRETESEHARR